MSMGEDAGSVVRIRSLHHSFGAGDVAKPVLIDINLELRAGEITVMTGPSGSGKTTLLTLIGGLRSVQSGSLEVLGQEIRGLSQAHLVGMRRRIGFIFQAHNLFESLTAYQNVRMALDLGDGARRGGADTVTEILTDVGLGERLHAKPAALSGGQRQRVAIARALVNRPPIILADEPTAALDKDSSRHVVTLLQRLARDEGATVVLVTHDNRILDVADRIVTLVDGRVGTNTLVQESVRVCEFLLRCPVFSTLTPIQISATADKMERERHPPGTTLISQGDPGDRFYLIRTGEVEVFVDDGTGRRIIATLGEGQFFGERALITAEPRNATVVAKGAVEVYTLGQAEFRATLDASPSFKEQLLKVFFQRQ